MVIFEILFNTSYLLIIWYYVFKITQKKNKSQTETYFYLAFLLLAFGDTFHVGFRTVSYLLGDINYTIAGIKLIGLGSFATALTVTITYLYFAKALNESHRCHKTLNWLSIFVILRLILVILPQNHWFTQATYTWGLIRNAPLVIIGVLLIYEMFKSHIVFYKKFSWLILWSYLFYLPVILFVSFIPILGMLMIPKTIMYLLMLRLVYKEYFGLSTPE